MQAVFPIAGAALVFLEVTEAMFGHLNALPLGGSQVTQMAIVFGLAFVLHELIRVVANGGRK
jgi:hypothetical protein